MGTTKWGVWWLGLPWVPWIPWLSLVEWGPHPPSIVYKLPEPGRFARGGSKTILRTVGRPDDVVHPTPKSGRIW